MTTSGRHSFGLLETFVHLKEGGAAERVEAGGDFWPQLGNRTDLHDGRLMGVIRISEDTPNWEMHPAGDEFFYLLNGAIDLVLQDINGERVIELEAGEGCLVPRGLWHRLIMRAPGVLLFVTPGKGTQSRPALEV